MALFFQGAEKKKEEEEEEEEWCIFGIPSCITLTLWAFFLHLKSGIMTVNTSVIAMKICKVLRKVPNAK